MAPVSCRRYYFDVPYRAFPGARLMPRLRHARDQSPPFLQLAGGDGGWRMEGEGGFVCRPPPPLRSALSCACIAQTLHAQDMGWLFEYTKSAKTVRLLDSPECARREPAESWSRWVRAGTRYWHRTSMIVPDRFQLHVQPGRALKLLLLLLLSRPRRTAHRERRV